jgi:hypothetical protein
VVDVAELVLTTIVFGFAELVLATIVFGFAELVLATVVFVLAVPEVENSASARIAAA